MFPSHDHVGPVVSLTTDVIPAGAINKYFSNALARGAMSAGAGISYDSGTGVITSTITQYTGEMAQDAVGGILSAEFTYDDALNSIAINQIATAKLTGTKTSAFISDFDTAADARITAQKGVASGIASLDGGGKVPVSQLPSSLMSYLGTWDATTNTPTLADGAGDAGDVYRVSVAGSQNLGSGSITFDVGDYVIYNGTIWEKSDTTDAVASVNGYTGNVVLGWTDFSGAVPIAKGGTNNTSFIANGVAYFDGTKLTNHANFTFDGAAGIVVGVSGTQASVSVAGGSHDLLAGRFG